MRDDLTVVEVHAGRQIELVSVHVEFGDIGHPLLVGSLRKEVSLQDIGHVHIADAWDMPEALLRPNQRAQSHLFHQPLHALVVDGLRR